MIQRALNCVDPRLMDHGLRVAGLLDAMLETDGGFDADERSDLHYLALLHDVGAYRTEEIDRLVEFETGDVREHALYGGLFLRELSPLAEYADVVLYHHTPNRLLASKSERTRRLAQCLQVADRVDVLRLSRPDAGADEIASSFARADEGRFYPDVVELFFEADRRYRLLGGDGSGNGARHAVPPAADLPLSRTAAPYLDTLVQVIDFRSRHTVTHSVMTAWIAYELACRLLPDEVERARVYAGALLHDLGKIGIPLSVLEKPGRLDEGEMAVMRTHVALTERIVSGCVPDDVLRIAVRHHEKLDGSGYPRGLREGDLTLAERIVAVADIASALAGTRSYKNAYSSKRTLELLRDQRDRGLVDRAVVAAMERDYDDIMESVSRACLPLGAAHRRIRHEYRRLLSAAETTSELSGRPGLEALARKDDGA